MSFGHFAAGFADAFGESLLQKQQQDRLDKMAKLQGQLLELQIKGGERTLEAQTKVSDMMSGNQLGEFQIQPEQALGEFQITPGQTPDFLPGGDARNAPPIAQGMDPMSFDQMKDSPEGLSALMASGWFNTSDLMDKETDFERIADAAGIEKGSLEFQELAKRFLDRGAGSDPSAFLAQMMMQEKLVGLKTEREKTERTERERIEGTKVSVRNDYTTATKMVDLMKDLRNTALQTGVPFGEFLQTIQGGGAAIAEQFGFDVRKSNELISKRRLLHKYFQSGIIEGLERFAGTGGNVQNSKMKLLTEASAGMMIGEFENLNIIADTIENNLDMSRIQGIPIENEKEQRASIDEWRELSETLFDEQPPSAVDGPAAINRFKTMTKEAIDKIDVAEVAAEGDAALAALARRMEELGMD